VKAFSGGTNAPGRPSRLDGERRFREINVEGALLQTTPAIRPRSATLQRAADPGRHAARAGPITTVGRHPRCSWARPPPPTPRSLARVLVVSVNDKQRRRVQAAGRLDAGVELSEPDRLTAPGRGEFPGPPALGTATYVVEAVWTNKGNVSWLDFTAASSGRGGVVRGRLARRGRSHDRGRRGPCRSSGRAPVGCRGPSGRADQAARRGPRCVGLLLAGQRGWWAPAVSIFGRCVLGGATAVRYQYGTSAQIRRALFDQPRWRSYRLGASTGPLSVTTASSHAPARGASSFSVVSGLAIGRCGRVDPPRRGHRRRELRGHPHRTPRCPTNVHPVFAHLPAPPTTRRSRARTTTAAAGDLTFLPRPRPRRTIPVRWSSATARAGPAAPVLRETSRRP
jgi:hypothetical protein